MGFLAMGVLGGGGIGAVIFYDEGPKLGSSFFLILLLSSK